MDLYKCVPGTRAVDLHNARCLLLLLLLPSPHRYAETIADKLSVLSLLQPLHSGQPPRIRGILSSPDPAGSLAAQQLSMEQVRLTLLPANCRCETQRHVSLNACLLPCVGAGRQGCRQAAGAAGVRPC